MALPAVGLDRGPLGRFATDGLRQRSEELWDCLMIGLRCFRYLRSSQGRSHTSPPSRCFPTGHGNPSELTPIPSSSLGRCLTLRSGTQVLLNVCRHQQCCGEQPCLQVFLYGFLVGAGRVWLAVCHLAPLHKGAPTCRLTSSDGASSFPTALPTAAGRFLTFAPDR